MPWKTLTPLALDHFSVEEGGKPIYVESKQKQAWDRDEGGIRSKILGSFLQEVVAVQERLSSRICHQLGMRPEQFPIVLVVCDRALLGYTNHEGGIYLNLLPLVGSSPVEYAQSLHLTILDEFYHRVSSTHNTAFADSLAKLVYDVGTIPASLREANSQKRQRTHF